MGRRIIAILAAVALALAGAALVLLYASRADDRAIARASPTPVVVTLERVPAGMSLREALRTKLLVETRVPAASTPVDAMTSVDGSIASLVALTDIAPGQIVLSAAFGEAPQGVRRVNVPPDQLAVSVELSDPARVGTFVTPGSRITIFATYDLRSLENGEDADRVNGLGLAETSVWLADLEVLALGEQSLAPQVQQAVPGDSEDTRAAPSYLVTVAVTAEQAAKLVHGVNRHTLYLGLRGDDVLVGDERFGDITRDRLP